MLSTSHDDKWCVVVGGTKGHVEETIAGSLLGLYEAYEWRMIPKCTGRYTCRDHDMSHLKPGKLLEGAGIDCTTLKEYEFSLTDRDDKVRVIALDRDNNTGIITYVKKSSSEIGADRFVHTLNTPSGFRRKLEAIGISVTDCDMKYSC